MKFFGNFFKSMVLFGILFGISYGIVYLWDVIIFKDVITTFDIVFNYIVLLSAFGASLMSEENGDLRRDIFK